MDTTLTTKDWDLLQDCRWPGFPVDDRTWPLNAVGAGSPSGAVGAGRGGR